MITPEVPDPEQPAPLIEEPAQYPVYSYREAREVIDRQPTRALVAVRSRSGEGTLFQPLAPADPEGVGLHGYQSAAIQEILDHIDAGKRGIFLIAPSLTGKTQLITGPTNGWNDLGLSERDLIGRVRAPRQTIMAATGARYKSGEMSLEAGVSYNTLELATQLQEKLFGDNPSKRVVIFDELDGQLHGMRLKVLLKAADVVVVLLGGRMCNQEKRAIMSSITVPDLQLLSPDHAEEMVAVETSIQPLNVTQWLEYAQLFRIQAHREANRPEDDNTTFAVSTTLVQKVAEVIRTHHTPVSFFAARELLRGLFASEYMTFHDEKKVLDIARNLNNIRGEMTIEQLDFQIRSWLFAEGASLGAIISSDQLSQAFLRQRGT